MRAGVTNLVLGLHQRAYVLLLRRSHWLPIGFFLKKNPSYVNTNCHVRLCLCVLVRVVRATDGMGREPIYLSIYIYICIYESRLMSLYLTNYLPHLTCIFYFAAIAKEGA